MKIARFFSYIFAGIGILLLLGSVGFLLLNREAPVRIRELPREALATFRKIRRVPWSGKHSAAAFLLRIPVNALWSSPVWCAPEALRRWM